MHLLSFSSLPFPNFLQITAGSCYAEFRCTPWSFENWHAKKNFDMGRPYILTVSRGVELLTVVSLLKMQSFCSLEEGWNCTREEVLAQTQWLVLTYVFHSIHSILCHQSIAQCIDFDTNHWDVLEFLPVHHPPGVTRIRDPALWGDGCRSLWDTTPSGIFPALSQGDQHQGN